MRGAAELAGDANDDLFVEDDGRRTLPDDEAARKPAHEVLPDEILPDEILPDMASSKLPGGGRAYILRQRPERGWWSGLQGDDDVRGRWRTDPPDLTSAAHRPRDSAA